MQTVSHCENETIDLGRRVGCLIDQPMLIFLSGTLGAGKTRFVQGLASGLDIDPRQITSPTFTLMVPHVGRLTLVHVDAYRIDDPRHADQLGLDDWLASGCVMVVEWPERILTSLPTPDLTVRLELIGAEQRRITIVTHSPTGDLIAGQSGRLSIGSH
jgi:tRNA threonylcarbamoyladenosine biosynthesis protein TsaE